MGIIEPEGKKGNTVVFPLISNQIYFNNKAKNIDGTKGF